ncbi:uncharacterized protein LOC135472482 isoform X2 [Liolophura sinensis]|uniref:uncharacterized protein LOC135472482 isoform X2 n=1 Tax=Liolophura sinensis TaxID=3198878 RepID=UPI003159294E
MCKRLEPVPGSCTIASELFFHSSVNCKHQTPLEICEIKESGGKHRVRCSPNMCGQAGIELGLTNITTGGIHWEAFMSSESLEGKISDLVSGKASTKTFGFLLLKCASVTKKMTYDDVGVANYDMQVEPESTQMVWIPEFEGLRGVPTGLERQPEHVSISVIFLDSVSRHHFFRSLSRTVEMIEQINAEPKAGAKVLDFKLFQSIKARTFENLQALITGEIDLKAVPFGIHDRPDNPLHLEYMFNPLRSDGYRTLWLEDMCWHWEWGLPKDLLSFEKEMDYEILWHRFLKATANAGIDDVGPTVASCHILDFYGRKDPFYGPEALCYNGLHQHDYLLGYLRTQQELYRHHSSPLFSFFMSSISHEPTGRRLQTIDDAMAKYLWFAAQQPNTVTIVLSDHGNSYGDFMAQSSEAQVELYHPVLFIIVPDGLIQRLDRSEREALFINQNRLVSMLDLHMTLKSLTQIKVTSATSFDKSPAAKDYDIVEKGLLQPISPNRTCASLPLLRPNLCICQGYEQQVLNNTDYVLYAEFALGQLNNEIQRQFRKANPTAKAGFGHCQRLMAKWFDNVRVIYQSKDSFTVKLNLHIPNSDGSSMEVFLVMVQSGNSISDHISILSYERISTYGIYRKCADKSIDVKLCICSLSDPHSKVHPPSLSSLQQPVFYTETAVSKIEREEPVACLYLLRREYLSGVNFEVANVCQDRTFTFTFDLKTINTVSSVTAWPLSLSLSPGDVYHLCSEIQTWSKEHWDWKYTVHFS